jgi:4-hydroxybenzoate polyprenyltransferase
MRDRLRLYLDLIRWNRPAGWLLLLWPSLSALWVAAEGWPGWHLLVVFVLGTILMRSAGCCINDVADREFDRHVKRTAERPVTRGAVSVREALCVGAVLALLFSAAGFWWRGWEGFLPWPAPVAAFLFFRLFDIWKPWLVGRADRRHDAAGVMLDDLWAGLFAGIATIVAAGLYHIPLVLMR